MLPWESRLACLEKFLILKPVYGHNWKTTLRVIKVKFHFIHFLAVIFEKFVARLHLIIEVHIREFIKAFISMQGCGAVSTTIHIQLTKRISFLFNMQLFLSTDANLSAMKVKLRQIFFLITSVTLIDNCPSMLLFLQQNCQNDTAVLSSYSRKNSGLLFTRSISLIESRISLQLSQESIGNRRSMYILIALLKFVGRASLPNNPT